MAKPDSIRLKKEALQCEVAARLADFLEDHDPRHSYDFVLPDLLEFSCEETLLRLRTNVEWQVLESEFKAVGGLLSEDWVYENDEIETDEIVPSYTEKLTPKAPKSRRVGLIILTLAASAFIGGLLGWHYPHFSFPVLTQQQNLNTYSD
jgi:hypothetical protein